jgi:hypothetical protein
MKKKSMNEMRRDNECLYLYNRLKWMMWWLLTDIIQKSISFFMLRIIKNIYENSNKNLVFKIIPSEWIHEVI